MRASCPGASGTRHRGMFFKSEGKSAGRAEKPRFQGWRVSTVGFKTGEERGYGQKVLEFIGGADADRTRDLLNAIQALSQTELQPHRIGLFS